VWHRTPHGICDLSKALGCLIVPATIVANGFNVVAQFESRQWIIATVATMDEAKTLLSGIFTALTHQRRAAEDS
jgi:hypothetical protein